jgi:hypothetical protein
LPGPVLEALSFPGIDAARFYTVTEALGLLPVAALVDLANRLIRARGQYVVHRMSVCDRDNSRGLQRERLEAIGVAAGRLLRLLYRDGIHDPGPWNLHPAITLALPTLVEISSDRPGHSWVDQGLTRFAVMLSDLAGVSAEAIFPTEFPKQRGGERRAGSTPATRLVENLIAIYAAIRDQFPDSGPAPAFKAVRAGGARLRREYTAPVRRCRWKAVPGRRSKVP